MANTKSGVPTPATTTPTAVEGAGSESVTPTAESVTPSAPTVEPAPSAEPERTGVWVESAVEEETAEVSEARQKAAEIAAEDATLRAENPDMVVKRSPVDGIGGQGFDYGKVEAAESEDEK